MTSPGIFQTYKQRGEWVELLFMTRAAGHRFNVSKPWGDSTRYEVSVENEGRAPSAYILGPERGLSAVTFLR